MRLYFVQALGTKENERNDSSDEETATAGDEHNCDDVIANGHASPTSNGTTASEQTEPEETKTDHTTGPEETKTDHTTGPEETKTDHTTGPEETKTDQSNGTATSDQTEPQETKEVQSNGIELEAEKKVESSMDIEGKVEVVTSVKVQASGSDQEEEEGEGDEVPKRKTSTEVAIAEVKSALTITMIRENTIDVPASDTESDGTSQLSRVKTIFQISFLFSFLFFLTFPQMIVQRMTWRFPQPPWNLSPQNPRKTNPPIPLTPHPTPFPLNPRPLRPLRPLQPLQPPPLPSRKSRR